MKKAGSIIADFFKRSSVEVEKESLDYTSIWKHVTGENIYKCTRPVALKKGTLYVEVEDSVWLYQLTLLKDKIITDFNSFAAGTKIDNISFVNKGKSLAQADYKKTTVFLKEKKDSSIQIQKISKVRLSTSEKEEIDKIVCNVPDRYKNSLKRLVNNFFRLQHWKRDQGAVKCKRCWTMFLVKNVDYSNEPVCHICRREMK